MKKIILASALMLTAGAAIAGGLHDPIVEPMVVAPEVVEQAAKEHFADEWVLALMTFLTIVVLGLGS